ncbi:histidine kinase [Flammeovirga sp. SubArs3]|uniref:sensor histidine kinase n=1 Tax=Flammeovirga sp. SubArs3 TaxID=2995316 RepID=UPI00248CB0EA|nr:histidine kinase [Flammeovirga sp. SubArs3]
MTFSLQKLKDNYDEITYQGIIILILFIYFSYTLDGTQNVSLYSLISIHKFAFFGNYLVAAIIINYFLLPYFYYRNQTLLFIIFLSFLISFVILTDEFILEQIYYPDTRGQYFPGILFTLIETLPLIFIMVAFKIVWDFNKKQSEIEQLKSLMNESELQFLKYQINPHFLFNHLNNLYAYALEESPKTPSIILELSSVLRYMLYDCKENEVMLSKELMHLKNYTALNELQIHERGIVNYKEEILSSDFKISPLILVVFIENAFKHSNESQIKNITIDIDIVVNKDGLLTFTCINNFLPHFAKSTHSGIGLENVKKRLHLLYPNQHELSIESIDNLFKVTLTLNLKHIEI